jgi:pyrimidine deaminase RibD-like protein
VRDGEVLGEGYHVGPGRDHAEVAAIKNALRHAGLANSTEGGADSTHGELSSRELLAGSTMYVSLEPCCTYGRTPPCTEALKRAGFGRIVAGVIDPSPDVNGAGLEILRAAGMQVDVADGDIAHSQTPELRRQKGHRLWAALCHLQVRHDPRRSRGHRLGRFPLDLKRREQGPCASMACVDGRCGGGGGHSCVR